MIIAALRQCRHLVIITEVRNYLHLVITYTLKERNNVHFLGEKNIHQKFGGGGGHGPVSPGYLLRTIGQRGNDIFDAFTWDTDADRQVYQTVVDKYNSFCAPRVKLMWSQ